MKKQKYHIGIAIFSLLVGLLSGTIGIFIALQITESKWPIILIFVLDVLCFIALIVFFILFLKNRKIIIKDIIKVSDNQYNLLEIYDRVFKSKKLEFVSEDENYLILKQSSLTFYYVDKKLLSKEANNLVLEIKNNKQI